MGDRGKLMVVATTLLALCGEVSTGGEEEASWQWRRTHHAQGTQMQGMELGVAVQLSGMQIGGREVLDVRLSGTALSGRLPGRGAVQGRDFVGALLLGTGPGGRTVRLSVAGIEADPQDESGETLLYTLRTYDAARASWQNACRPDGRGVRKAIPVAGTWDESGAHEQHAGTFTFGCTSGVIAKCVRWGYKPWKTVNGKSLTDYHQACTRMARADYCGDGVSHTREGTLINVYDDLGIQAQARADGMAFEASWTPAGAACLQKQRFDPSGLSLLLECPEKISVAPAQERVRADPCDMELGKGPTEVLLRNRSYVQMSL